MYAITRADTKYKDTDEWGSRENSGALNIIINSMLARQEVSHQQVMSYILGTGDCYTSHSFHILSWGAFDRYVQLLEKREHDGRIERLAQDGLSGGHVDQYNMILS